MTDPLTAAALSIVFLDLQEGIVNLGKTTETERVRTSVAALADLANIFGLPVVMSAVPTTGGTVAAPLSEIVERLPAVTPIVRTTAGAMNDPAFRTALEAAGRRTLVLAGVATEVVVRLTALEAKRAGYTVVIAVDACSGFDPRTESATFMQLAVAGIDVSSVTTIAAELSGDFGTDNGRAAMRAMQSVVGGHTRHSDDSEDEHEHEHGSGVRRL